MRHNGVWLTNSRSGEARVPHSSGDGQTVDVDFNIENVTIEYKVVTSLDDVGENDHVMMIVDDIPNKEGDDRIGLATKNGRISAVETGTISGGNFDETAFHELGHNLSLSHTDGGGLMEANINGSTSVSTQEKGTIFSRGTGAHALGVGTHKASDNYTRHSRDLAKEFLKTNGIQ